MSISLQSCLLSGKVPAATGGSGGSELNTGLDFSQVHCLGITLGVTAVVSSFRCSFVHSQVHKPAVLLPYSRCRAQYGGLRNKQGLAPALGSERNMWVYDISRAGESHSGV